ncbi:MAG: DUF456 domain-containing protein [Marivirga sp.]|nr:DUF456 domain-containing protein [Marivirga sp.]
MMATVLIIIGIILLLAGIAGCILPLLPGPPLCFLALLIQQLNDKPPFTTDFLLIWAGITIVVTILDYVIPLYGTRKFGGSKYGIWGCTIGLIAGFWLGPFGIIIGPFVGAFVGEIIANNDSATALKSAFGSFIGFLFGTLLKLVVCVTMCWYFVQFVYHAITA